jgi:hypothetical protein
MRTRVLICAAAVAAGALSAVAQSNVYSLNVVGYVNLSLKDGFNMIANQLDADGFGTNNTIKGVFGAQLPPGTTVYAWNGAGYSIEKYTKTKDGSATNWSTPDYSLNPGQAAWVSIPTGSGNVTVTTVGTVLQGALVNPNIPTAGGYTMVSSLVPLSGGLVSALGYNAGAGDQVYQWNGSGYTINKYTKSKDGTKTNWSLNSTEPTIAVGEGFWLQVSAGAAWSNYFKVQ